MKIQIKKILMQEGLIDLKDIQQNLIDKMKSLPKHVTNIIKGHHHSIHESTGTLGARERYLGDNTGQIGKKNHNVSSGHKKLSSEGIINTDQGTKNVFKGQARATSGIVEEMVNPINNSHVSPNTLARLTGTFKYNKPVNATTQPAQHVPGPGEVPAGQSVKKPGIQALMYQQKAQLGLK